MTQALTNQAVKMQIKPGATIVHEGLVPRPRSETSPVIASVHGHAQAQIVCASDLSAAVKAPAS
jgi:hypothetical protein